MPSSTSASASASGDSYLDTRLFEGRDHARLYSASRPLPSKALIDKIINFTKESKGSSPPFNLALDIGCGSGQATATLVQHFDRIAAFDVSEAQIAEANRIKEENGLFQNVEFSVSPAETLPVPSSSADLVSVSTAAHWFDLPRFLREVDRVLAPGGVLAMYGYCGAWATVKGKPAADRAVKEWYDETRHYATERHFKYVVAGYETMPTPYPDTTERIKGAEYDYEVRWSLRTLVDFLRSLSYHQRLERARGVEEGDRIMKRLTDKIRAEVGAAEEESDEDVILDVVHPFYGVLAAKPKAFQCAK